MARLVIIIVPFRDFCFVLFSLFFSSLFLRALFFTFYYPISNRHHHLSNNFSKNNVNRRTKKRLGWPLSQKERKREMREREGDRHYEPGKREAPMPERALRVW